MNAEDHIRQRLAGLGPTLETALSFLRERNIKGYPTCPDGCLLAEHLNRNNPTMYTFYVLTHDDGPAIRSDYDTGVVEWWDGKTRTVPLPDHLNQLALNFDDKQYPDLIAEV
jgi:hypothetical protein